MGVYIYTYICGCIYIKLFFSSNLFSNPVGYSAFLRAFLRAGGSGGLHETCGGPDVGEATRY